MYTVCNTRAQRYLDKVRHGRDEPPHLLCRHFGGAIVAVLHLLHPLLAPADSQDFPEAEVLLLHARHGAAGLIKEKIRYV